MRLSPAILEDAENHYRLALAEIDDEVHALCEALVAFGRRLPS
jgi:hypothetical protein